MLSVNLCGLKLENPTVLSSGILDMNADIMGRIVESGAGAITTKSISLEPNKGWENPTTVEIPSGIINAMGLPNPGFEEFSKEMVSFKKTHPSIPLIGSCFGKMQEEYPKIAGKMDDIADAIELNLSCPNKEGVLMIGQDPVSIKRIVSEVKSITTKPVIAKLTPNTANIKELAIAAVDGGCDMISAINTVSAMKIDIETGMPVLSNIKGGYSGPGIKPIAIRCVYEVCEAVDVPVIGIGGVVSGDDAIEMIMAGAWAVGIGTGIAYEGTGIFKKVVSGMKAYLSEHGHKGISDIRGISHRIY